MTTDLQDHFATFEELQRESFGNDIGRMTTEERIQYITWNMVALHDELSEALAEVGWKPWASSRHINAENFLGEMVDAWHFFMNLVLAAGLTTGLTPEEVADRFSEMFFEKALRNAERQAEGYDGLSGKCSFCSRDTGDLLVHGNTTCPSNTTNCPVFPGERDNNG